MHGKGSLLGKMPGDEWQKFANLRLLFGYMYAQPGKKLLFMGGEFGQWNEWSHDRCTGLVAAAVSGASGTQKWVRDLNHLCRNEKALHDLDSDPAGFEWIDCNDAPRSVVSLLRKGKSARRVVLVACNFTPVPRENIASAFPRGILEGTAEQRWQGVRREWHWQWWRRAGWKRSSSTDGRFLWS